ncbi:MAG: archease [Nanoarchaeota archaeon]|nr:archease [Nanoarchaeota archaeon]
MKYKFLSHTADVKFQAEGKTLEEAFSNAVLALRETIAGKIEIKGKKEKKISVKGKDFESLLYNFLEEFLVLLDADDFLVSKVKDIKIDKNKFKLNAVVLGDKASDYKFSNAVKAVTYNEMFIKVDKNKNTVQVVLDV